MEKLKRGTDLMEKGFACLEEGDYEKAIEIGRKLKRLRHSSAFEILALAHLRSDKLCRAITVLEEGVAKAGRAWILWELLANCYSDAGRYSRAERAYQKALGLEQCDRDVIHLNRAIAFNRAAKHTAAQEALRLVKSPRLRRRSDACRVRTALKLGAVRSARQLALRLSRSRPSKEEHYDRESESEILLSCASALRTNLATTARALRLAFRAVEGQPNNAEALELIRRIRHRQTPHLRLFRLLINGVWHFPIGKSTVPPGFFRTVEVAAASERAAFRNATLFFPKQVRESLSVEEVKTLDTQHPDLEGVYFLSGYMFYPRRKKR